MHLHFDRYTLPNGLRVIHHHAPDAGKVVVNVLYRVGAKHEDERRTGFAHLFEHLMFEGSTNVQHYDQHVERAGGESNAYTTNDITNYYISLPANQLETALWLESDRMLELDFREDKLAVQRNVVCEEFKQRYLNQPYGDAYLHLRPLMFTAHPYRWMTIGQRLEHIEHATLDDVRDFFFRFYAPDNATLVIAGGVSLHDARPLVEKWFGNIPNRNVQKPVPVIEPLQTEARTATLTAKNIPHTQVYKAWHIPARNAPNYLPVELWSEVLTGGKSSRLYQKLVVEQQVASSIGAFSWSLHDTGQFSLNAQLASGRTVADYEQALNEALTEIATTAPVTESELTRLKTKYESADFFEKVSLMNRAQALAMYDCIAEPEWINTEPERLRGVSLADMEAFRAMYLRSENCSTLKYLPA
jgi:zinc protease